MTKHPPLLPGQYYHIYNRGNNKENIFIEEKNYEYFLNLYWKHIPPVADTYAFCLLKNHFHLLVRIKDETDLTGFQNLSGLNPKKLHLPFSHLFNAYIKAINKSYNRTGSLFQKPFKRKLITNQAHLTQTVIYIHKNPQAHGFVDDFRDWKYSSYHFLIESQNTQLQQVEVLAWFGDQKRFEQDHEKEINQTLHEFETES